MCRATKGLKGGQKKAFLTGSNLSCCTHLHCHYEIYQQWCKERNIPENHHCTPWHIWRVMKARKNPLVQGTLDGIFMKETGPQEFSWEAVLGAIAWFVACNDQVCCEELLVDCS
jgi:hypothetical protein